jgi:hypothetical protein
MMKIEVNLILIKIWSIFLKLSLIIFLVCQIFPPINPINSTFPAVSMAVAYFT